jgi:hypothetical protein
MRTKWQMPCQPETVGQIDVFEKRSVATTGWLLTISTQDLGVPVLKIDDLNDVELQFYPYAVSRETAECRAVTVTGGAAAANIPFTYYLKYRATTILPPMQ